MRTPLTLIVAGTLILVSALLAKETLQPPPAIEDPAKVFEKKKEKLQPWNPSKGLPTTFYRIGLREKVVLVSSATFGDGGSQYWIIKDGENKHFAFWKEPTTSFDSDKKEKRELKWNERHFWVGTTHQGYYGGGMKVPLGSESERFLESILSQLNDVGSNKSSYSTPGSGASLRE